MFTPPPGLCLDLGTSSTSLLFPAPGGPGTFFFLFFYFLQKKYGTPDFGGGPCPGCPPGAVGAPLELIFAV